MINTTILRWIGNGFLIIGYGTLLYVDVKMGLMMKLIGGSLLFPSFYRLKMWDTIAISVFFAVLEGSKLIHLLTTK